MPSAAVAQRYLGNGGTLAYLMAATATLALLAGQRERLARLARRSSDRQALLGAVLTLLLILIAFGVLHPRVDVAHSSLALDAASSELIGGPYPTCQRACADIPGRPMHFEPDPQGDDRAGYQRFCDEMRSRVRGQCLAAQHGDLK